MKTIKTIILTVLVTVVAAVIFLLNTGIVKVEKRDVEHTKLVVVDGQIESETRWTDVVGCDVTIDVVDGVSFVWK
jgi:hypothetical protein